MIDITILYMASLFYYGIGCNIFYKYITENIESSEENLKDFWIKLGNDNQFVDSAKNYFRYRNGEKIFKENTSPGDIFDNIYDNATQKIYNVSFMNGWKTYYRYHGGGKRIRKSRKLRKSRKSLKKNRKRSVKRTKRLKKRRKTKRKY